MAAKLGENLQEIADRGNGEERVGEESEDGHFIGSGQQHKDESHEECNDGTPTIPNEAVSSEWLHQLTDQPLDPARMTRRSPERRSVYFPSRRKTTP